MKFQRPKLIKKQKRLGVSKKTSLLGITIFAFIGATVFATIVNATSGAKMLDLEKRAASLVTENEELSKQLIQAMSLSEAQESAEKFGFGLPENILYLTKASEVAKLP